MINPNFIPATAHDIPEILAMMQDFYAIDGYEFDKVKMGVSLGVFLADVRLGRLWLITNEGQTAGYVCLTAGFSFEYGGHIVILDELFITDSFRNKGLGKLSLTFVDDYAVKNQIRAVHMEVEGHNEHALSLYTSRGFKTKGRKLYTKYYE